MTEIPVACSLTDAPMLERERTVLADFGGHVIGVESRGEGYVVEIRRTDGALAAATSLISVERICCPFLKFQLTVEPGGGPMRLTMSGPPGTREMIEPWVRPWAKQG